MSTDLYRLDCGVNGPLEFFQLPRGGANNAQPTHRVSAGFLRHTLPSSFAALTRVLTDVLVHGLPFRVIVAPENAVRSLC